MSSLILRVATHFVMGLMLLLSVFVLLRGHNAPGGGFVGGLIAAAAFILYMISDHVEKARAVLPVAPRTLIWVGLAVAAASGTLPLFRGVPFFTGLWGGAIAAELSHLGTPVFFDVGVYLVVTGVALTILFGLAEE
jgi:multicomponent Na+:H+ antiporter subunit B